MEKRLRGFKSNKRELLDFAGELYFGGNAVSNISTFRRANPEFTTNDQAYEFLLEEYNNEVDRKKAESLAKEKAKKKAKRAELALQPKFVEMKKMDEIKFYKRFNFRYKNVNDMESLYKAVLDAGKRVQLQYLNLFLKKKDSNKIRGITISANDLTTFEDFLNAYNTIASGEFIGSDAINSDTDELIFDKFAVSSVVIAGGGKSDSMLFNVIGIESEDDNCSYKCLKKCGFVDEWANQYTYINIEKLRDVIIENALPISIITNSFTLKRSSNDIVMNGQQKKIMIKDKKGNNKLNICSKLEIGDIEVCYFHKDDRQKHVIIYDEFKQHYDLIDGEISICDDVYINLTCDVIKNEKILFKPKQINATNFSNKPVNYRYLVFDYETIINFEKSNCMLEYSLSILNMNDDELRALNDADEKNDQKQVNILRKKHCVTFLGYNCSIQFLNWISQNQENIKYTLIGFNNANFDNFILLDALLNSNNEDHNVDQIFYNGSQLLNFNINGRHDLFDIHKHLVGSLKANCESFKIKCCSKKSFDHNHAQDLYNEGKLIDYIHNNEELKEYNEYDVLATGLVFYKYKQAITNIKSTSEYGKKLTEMKTIGSLIYSVFQDNAKKKHIHFPELSLEQYQDLQRCKIAGRVQMFNGVKKVLERLVSTDVCSLYPYVMAVHNCYYPCGKIVETDVYKGDDVIGFYYCDIDQSNLRGLDLPNIYAFKTEIENNWDHDGLIENYLISNVMIGLLLKYGCKVVIKKGFYFTEKRKSCDVFEFLLDIMKEKNNQDDLKKMGSSEYNPALRETEKLLMNAVSGKIIEGLHCEKTTDISSVAEYVKICDKAKKVNVINSIGNKLFITYEVGEEKMIKKQRPVYLGVLVYDYAKRYMYENSYSKIGLSKLLYTDTDASKFRYTDFIVWEEWVKSNNVKVPHWEEVYKYDTRYKTHLIYERNSKIFGSFEDELEGLVGGDYRFYCLEKKSWLYSVDGKAKFRFKGLNENAILLDNENLENDEIFETITTKHNTGLTTTKYSLGDDNRKTHEYYNAASKKNIGNNSVKFFDRVYTDGHAYLLCSSFRKIVKNSLHDVTLGDDERYNDNMNKIQVNYMIKHISIKTIG